MSALAALFRDEPFYAATLVVYALAFLFYAGTWLSPRRRVAQLATATLVLALAGNLGLILVRWMVAGRPPFKSLHESLVFLAFCIAAVYLVMERIYRARAVGALATLGSVGALLYAVVKWDSEIVRLPPALQSAWFIPHVVVYFVGYGALFFATVVAVVQLVKPTLSIKAGSALTGALDLEGIGYDAIRFGFILLTVGLLIGSAWAKNAWGDYWVWDPKESWSLVTWLVYGAYLHMRHVKGLRGKAAAWMAIAGFAVVLFTYLGMSVLPTADQSDHVYQ